MEHIKINNKRYVSVDDIFDKAPIYCKGSRNGRELVKNKELTSSDFIFAKKSNDEWVESEGKSVKYDKVFLKKKLVDKLDEINGIKTEYNGIEEAPDVIELENHEKFQDNDKNIVEIETRGERKANDIYFLVKDVSKAFNMKSLSKTLIDERKAYHENEHYKYFICKIVALGENKTSKQLFLTYEGILRVLFASNNTETAKFISWATHTLFTAQMGTEKQKRELSSKLLGVSTQAIKEVFASNSTKTPIVYLYLIGNANELLKTDEYDDDQMLCKYGCTEDMVRRSGEHEKKFNKEFGTNIELICFSIIEAQFIFNAEQNIKTFFSANKVEYKKHKELIVISKKEMVMIKDHYKMIQHSYIGRFKELNDQIHKLELELTNKNHEIELLIKTHSNELLIEKHKNELKDKDIELLKYKVLLLERN
jgi:hypothetical protein